MGGNGWSAALGVMVVAAACTSATGTDGADVSGLGSLTILSEPPGAQVLVDGIAVGVTPLTVGSLRPGTHRLQLSLEGFLTKAASVQTTGGNDEVKFTLVRPATLTVVADVEGVVDVWLDSLHLGVAPVTREGLKPGQYMVRATRAGRPGFAAQITLAPAAHDTVRAVPPAAEGLSATAKLGAAPVRPPHSRSNRPANIAACIAFAVFAGIVIAVDLGSD